MTFDLETLGSGWDCENGFYLLQPQSRIHKMLGQYEIYKLIASVPGDVVEFGVYKGASLVRWAAFRAVAETETARMIIGFDSFGAFPSEGVSRKADKEFIQSFERDGGHGIAVDSLYAALERKSVGNVKLVEGDVFKTLPSFLEKNQALRFALVHLDFDVAEPTQFVLESVIDLVNPGGVVVIDDFGQVAGATEVVERFCLERGYVLRTNAFYRAPAFFIKE